MSFFSRLFGSKTQPAQGADVEARLAELEEQAEKARPGYVGSALNRAGDLALKTDQPDRAVGFYGRAIDAFLDDAQRELARGVANKIIRVRPSAIRTLCTITWLDLAAQHQASALMHLRDYVTAAEEAGQQARAATQIHMMAASSPDSEFIDAVADALDALDYPRRAKEVRGWIAMGAPGALDDALAISDACMKAAIRSNDKDLPLLVDDPEQVAGESSGDVDAAAPGEAEEAATKSPEQAESVDGQEDADAAEPESVEEVAADADPPKEEAAATAETSGQDTEAAADSSSSDRSRKGGKSGKSKKKRKKKKR